MLRLASSALAAAVLLLGAAFATQEAGAKKSKKPSGQHSKLQGAWTVRLRSPKPNNMNS